MDAWGGGTERGLWRLPEDPSRTISTGVPVLRSLPGMQRQGEGKWAPRSCSQPTTCVHNVWDIGTCPEPHLIAHASAAIIHPFSPPGIGIE